MGWPCGSGHNSKRFPETPCLSPWHTGWQTPWVQGPAQNWVHSCSFAGTLWLDASKRKKTGSYDLFPSQERFHPPDYCSSVKLPPNQTHTYRVTDSLDHIHMLSHIHAYTQMHTNRHTHTIIHIHTYACTLTHMLTHRLTHRLTHIQSHTSM